jgi:diaminopimelate decarboxylase
MSEFIRFDAEGRLRIEDLDAAELADRFDTPLYVTSEQQIRLNARRFHRAFADRYPRVTVLYANKANDNLAIRHILTQEDAGGDCFGLGELTVSLQSGVPPSKLVLNGSNKTTHELRAAIEIGATINLDHPGELEHVDQLARSLEATALVNLRVLPFSFADPAQLTPELAVIAADRSHDKWGMDRETVRLVLARALGFARVKVRGVHMHVSRLRPTSEHFDLASRLMIDCLADLKDRFGWRPEVVDIGGGFAHDRDPESGRPSGDHRVAMPEEYAEVVVKNLAKGFATHGLGEPELLVEPGRRLVSNAAVLLTRVGVVKRLPSATATWVNVDASTNHALRTKLMGYYYEIVHATRGREPDAIVANVTGPTCTLDLLGEARPLPSISSGDLLAVLDVGGYAEVLANHFNLLPRPASVLVSGGRADLIRRRETIQDLLEGQIVPLRLMNARGHGRID